MSCNCDEDWMHTIKYKSMVTTSTNPVMQFSTLSEAKNMIRLLESGKIDDIMPDLETPVLSVNYYPVLVCEGCDMEINANEDGSIDVEKYYSNFVRKGEHFENDLHVLLLELGYYMNKADKSLEWFKDKEESE